MPNNSDGRSALLIPRDTSLRRRWCSTGWGTLSRGRSDEALAGFVQKGSERTLSPLGEGGRHLIPPSVRQFVPAERVLRFTSPRSETPQRKARAGVFHPNG